MDVLPHLLPFGPDLHIEACAVATATKHVTVALTAIAPQRSCPLCSLMASRIHSRYQRTMHDLPWADLTVRIQLQVRKFFCDNPACLRKIFTERLPSVVAPSARRSQRLVQHQQQLGLALGGNAGARMSVQLHCPASRNTLLRQVRRLPLPTPEHPEIIGVDDWSWRKGLRYGTIILDLEQHTTLALLPDRDADSLAAWLRTYPSIRIIARDRAGVYAEGATKGAPQAMQVADRFHLIRNLSDTILAVFEQYAKPLRRLTTPELPAGQPAPPGVDLACPVTEAIIGVLPPPMVSPRHQAQAEHRRATRLGLYTQVHALHAQGWPLRAIGRHLGLNRNTVRSYVRSASFPERQPRVLRQAGVLDPFIPYLLERWNAGCRTGTVLWKELIDRGYQGKRSLVFTFVTRLRKALGMPTKNRTITTGTVVVPDQRPLTPRGAVWLVLRRPEERDEPTRQRLMEIQATHVDLTEAIALAETFTELIRAGKVAALDDWLKQAANSTLTPFRSFAASLQRDYAAVRAGVELPWSTGPVEGMINRLKMLKRTMFGRAGVALLERRLVLTG
jgi:transposase